MASGHFNSVSLTPDELSAIKKASECEDLEAILSFGVWKICQGRKLSQANLVEEGICHVREVANADFSPSAAKMILGMLLECGIVDNADRTESLKWFRLADASGCPGACEKVAEIERQVREDQRREQERLEVARHQQEVRLKEVQLAQRKPILELIENGLVKIPGKEVMVARTHVTQALWKVVMGDNPSRFKGADYPVESISWDQGCQFVETLNRDEEVVRQRLKFRLPISAELRHLGSYGNIYDARDYDNYCWSRANSDYSTHPVGTKKPTSIRVFDMYGNVMTWCDDECKLSGYKFAAGSSWCDSLASGGGIAKLNKALDGRRINHDCDIVPATAKCSCIGLRLVAYKN